MEPSLPTWLKHLIGPPDIGHYTFGTVQAQEVTGDGTMSLVSGTTDENIAIGVDIGP